MREEKLVKLEEDLKRVTGIRQARVVGVETPSEIHIVASPGRSAKQLVRDVQSLASAGFGLEIDHRIVSIVQLGDGEVDPGLLNAAGKPGGTGAQEVVPKPALGPSEGSSARPQLETVVLTSKGDTGWVKVTLKWPSGRTTEGAGPATATRESRARGAANALQQALEPVLNERGAHLDIHQILLQSVGANDSVLVQGYFSERGAPTPIVGSAIVTDDVATAAVHALLQAINRKIDGSP